MFQWSSVSVMPASSQISMTKLLIEVRIVPGAVLWQPRSVTLRIRHHAGRLPITASSDFVGVPKDPEVRRP